MIMTGRYYGDMTVTITGLQGDNVGRMSSSIGGRIYVVVVLAVLLYGLKSWVLTSSMLNTIRGFHHYACWWLADKSPTRQQNGIY